jgi:hypothetical protein
LVHRTANGPSNSGELRSRPRRALCLPVLAALALAPAGASAAPQPCRLQPSPHLSPQNEFASCLPVAASISRAPAMGEEAVLRVTVRAEYARPDTRVAIDLPTNLSFADTPARFTKKRARTGAGPVRRAVTRTDIAASSPTQFRFRVRADALGFAPIHVSASAQRRGGSTDGGGDDLFLQVAQTPAKSSLAPPIRASARGSRLANGAMPVKVPRSGRNPPPLPTDLAVPTSDDEPTGGPDAAQATSCATGRGVYFDQDNILRGISNVVVQVWDQDSSSADDLLASGFANNGGANDGGFNLCFTGTDGEGGGQEVYVRFSLDNSRWRIRDTAASNTSYGFGTSVQAICDGCNATFGAWHFADAAVDRASHAYDSINDFWNWKPGGANACWDANDAAASCRQIIVNWTKTSVDGTYYDLGTNDVHLAAIDPDFPDLPIHESAHAVMDDIYEDAFPSAPSCNPHDIRFATSQGCAWTEGYAEWVPATVQNEYVWEGPNNYTVQLETPTWTTSSYDDGDAVEGRIAGSMIDISDGANEAFWDRRAEGDPGDQWTTLLNTHSDTFNEFIITDRGAQGFDTSLSGSTRSSVFQNAIDYTYRDPLTDGVQLTRPSLDVAPTPHNFTYTTAVARWSGVAIRPPAASDYDLRVLDDAALSTQIGQSSAGGSTIDYVLVDSHHRALGDYYPQAYRFNGAGQYSIERSDQTLGLTDGVIHPSMTSGDIIRIVNTTVSAGVPTFFRVIPTGGSQDPELLLHDSDPATTTTWVQGRSAATASATVGGPGAAEGLVANLATTDDVALVLLNKAGSGTYDLYRDTTAPTGSVAINGGAAVARSQNVTLNLSASDAQTGIDAMRISTDGAMDTEPFVPFSATAPATLPAGDGTKTVRVQYRNRAGMPSSVVSDTIRLDTRPDLLTSAIANPPASGQLLSSFGLSTTVLNSSGSTAGASTTRFHLSADATLDAGDVLLGGSQSVPSLTVGNSSTSSPTLTIPAGTRGGVYRVIGCADDLAAVNEFDETNNCRVSTGTIEVQAPDLVVNKLNDPPAAAADGDRFRATDTNKNVGNLAAGASTTRYYLSPEGGGADVHLTNSRSVPGLAPGATDAGGVRVRIPPGTGSGIYRLRACADDLGAVLEDRENNNCRVSAGTIDVS